MRLLRTALAALAGCTSVLALACSHAAVPRSSAPPSRREEASQKPTASGAADAQRPATAPVSAAHTGAFHVAVDAPVRRYHLDGATWLSDGNTIAVPYGEGFVQDGALSAPPECSSEEEFTGLAGTLPDRVWALRASVRAPGLPGAGGARLLRWTGHRWELATRLAGKHALLEPWASGSGLLLTWSQAARRDGYSLQVLGAPASAKPPSASVGRACRTSLVEPTALVTTARGDAMLLGTACEVPGRARVEVWTRASGDSTVLDAPDGVELTAIALGPNGQRFVGGRRGRESYVATREKDGWAEFRAPPGRVTGLTAAADGSLWLVLDAPPKARVASFPFEERAVPIPAKANLWRRPPGGSFEPVVLPEGVGNARYVDVDLGADAAASVFVTTAEALLGSTEHGKMLWSPETCPSPVTGARAYGRRTVPAGAMSVLSDSNQTGSCELHFVLIDEAKVPTSSAWTAAADSLRATTFRSALEEGEAAPKTVGGPGPDLLPVVAYEAGMFRFGFQVAGDVERKSTRFVSVLKGQIEREICARPLPLRRGAPF